RPTRERPEWISNRLQGSRLIYRTTSTSSGIGCAQGATFLRRCGEWRFQRRTAGCARWEYRCGLHNAPCSIGVWGRRGKAGRFGDPVPQIVICRVGERDGVRKSGLLPLRCYETAVDPVINHPHADAVSLADLADAECPGGKRRAGDAMLVADPTYHADREGFAGELV